MIKRIAGKASSALIKQEPVMNGPVLSYCGERMGVCTW